MVFIDRSLCTGCGICVDACPTEAISLTDSAAVIDKALCTSCGRCLDICLTGAIIRGEDDSVRPLAGAPAGYRGARPSGAGAPALPAVIAEDALSLRAAAPYDRVTVVEDASAAPIVEARRGSLTRLEFAERALLGLFNLIAYALELKQRRAMTAPAVASSVRQDFTTGRGSGARVRARAGSLTTEVRSGHVIRGMSTRRGTGRGRRMGPGGCRGNRRGWNNGCGAP